MTVSAVILILAAGAGGPPDEDRHLKVARRFADAMLEHGRDTYGPEKTPLFASALDRAAKKIVEGLPLPEGIRKGDRTTTAANPMYDENFFRLLYALSEVTADKRYATAADEALRFFFTRCQSPVTGLLPWGEHLGWDLRSDGVLHGRDKHEFFRPWVLWEKCYALAPAESLKFARGVWDHQIADQSTGAFSRHASYSRHAPEDGHHEFPRHAGFYIRTWGEAYARGKDPVFVKAIETLVNYFARRRKPHGGFPCQGDSDTIWWDSDLSWAIDVWETSSRMPAPLAAKMKEEAAKTDAAFLRQFAAGLPATTEDVWASAYGKRSTATLAMMCHERHLQRPQDGLRRLVLQAADLYLTAEAPPSTYPCNVGSAIALLMAAHRMTKEALYLARAEVLADAAVETYWGEDALPRATPRNSHYENITGADTLALSLLELWSLRRRPSQPLTFSWIDR